MLNRSNCYLCESKKIRHFLERKDGVPVYICEKCGFRFVKKLNISITKLYSDNYFNKAGYVDFKSQPAIIFLWQYAFIKIFSKPQQVNLLEVGCAYGKLLEILSLDEYRLFGLEIIKEASRECQRKGFKVENKGAEGVKSFKESSLDILVAWELIEHLEDPVSFFEEVKRITKEDSVIIFSTPNATEKNSDWVGYKQSFEHLSYFTTDSLGKVLTNIFGRKKWEIISFKHHGDYDTMVVIIKNSGFNNQERAITKKIRELGLTNSSEINLYLAYIYGKFYDDNKEFIDTLARSDKISALGKYFLYTLSNQQHKCFLLEKELVVSPLRSIFWRMYALNLQRRVDELWTEKQLQDHNENNENNVNS